MPILQLQPIHKDYVWGGNTLIKQFHMETNKDTIAESWTLSCHPDGESVDLLSKRTLSDVLQSHPEYAGTKAMTFTRFPIMVKLIDANRDLSIQVHPNDAMGQKLENEYGKTEMWYVLDHAPNAFLYYGFQSDITKEELQESLEQGTILDKLNKVYVKTGDVFFVRAGTVHAIGAGIVIAEIQQNSNATYRLFDYHRLDADGKPRPLHIEKALLASNLNKSDIPVQLHTQGNYKETSSMQLISCEYFTVRKIALVDYATQYIDETSFMHLQIVDGGGHIMDSDHKKIAFRKGDSFFITANHGALSLYGNATILATTI